MACLLFVCFENVHGYYGAGSKHMRCGVSLLEQWQAQNLRSSHDSISSKVQLDSLIHDEVFQIFSRLDTRAFAHLGTESPLYSNAKLLLWEMVRHEGFHIPTTFADLLEARKCSEPSIFILGCSFFPTTLPSKMGEILFAKKRRYVSRCCSNSKKQSDTYSNHSLILLPTLLSLQAPRYFM